MTPQELMDTCWARDLPHADLAYYARCYNVSPVPTSDQYREHCTAKSEAMARDFDTLPRSTP